MLRKDHGADYILAVGGLTLFGNQPADSKIFYYSSSGKNFPALVPEYKKHYRDLFHSPSIILKKSGRKRLKRICEKYQIRRSILA